MKKNMCIYFFVVTVSFFSLTTMGMGTPTIADVTKEEGTPQEEQKIEDNKNSYGGPSAGIGRSSLDDIDDVAPENNTNNDPKKTIFSELCNREEELAAWITKAALQKKGASVFMPRFIFEKPKPQKNPDLAIAKGYYNGIKKAAESRGTNKYYELLAEQDGISVHEVRLKYAIEEGENTGWAIATRDYALAKAKIGFLTKHPLTHLKSLGIQGIETGIVQGAGHVIAKLFIAGVDKIGGFIYSQCTITGQKSSMDLKSQKIMEEIALLAGDKQMIDQLKKQGFQSDKTKFYDQQIPLIANNKLDEWTDNRLSRWGLKYVPKKVLDLNYVPLSLSVDPMIEDEEPILTDIDTINTNDNAVPN